MDFQNFKFSNKWLVSTIESSVAIISVELIASGSSIGVISSHVLILLTPSATVLLTDLWPLSCKSNSKTRDHANTEKHYPYPGPWILIFFCLLLFILFFGFH